MKCFSRSTLGVIIGILNVLIYIVVSVYSTFALINLSSASKGFHDIHELKHKEKPYDDASLMIIFSVTLVVSLIMIIISGLLIMGIVKKRHNLMLPWLIISCLGFAANTIKFLITLVVIIIAGITFGQFMIIFLLGVILIGIQTLILWQIFTLYKDIRDNKSKGQVISAPQVGYAANTMSSYQPQTDFYNPLPPKNIN